MKLGVVIVTYQSADRLGVCLDACLQFQESLEAGVLVVDNHSSDNWLDQVKARPGVRWIANSQNLGFAAAVNAGVRALVAAEAVLVMNPDVVLESSPGILAEQLADPSVGAVAGQLLGADGQPQTGFQVRNFPTPAALCFEALGVNRIWRGNPVNRNYRCLDDALTSPCDVEQPPAACLLVRRQAWLVCGGFDEAFFPVWFEDVDFCKRLDRLGWRIRFTPKFRAAHAGGHSFTSLGWGTRQLYWYGNLLRYSSRHFATPAKLAVCASVAVGLVPRVATGIVSERSFQPLGVYAKVLRLIGAYLRRGPAIAGPAQNSSRAVVGGCGSSGP